MSRLARACASAWLFASVLSSLPATAQEPLSVPLIDQHGKEFQLSALQGRITVLVFGFTHCPYICPVEMARASAALRELEPLDKQVAAVFITVDPARDSPEIIDRYLDSYHPGFIGLTGTPQALSAVAKHYQVTAVERATASGGYQLDHGTSLFILNRRAEPQVAVLPGLPASHIAAVVRQLL